MAILCGDNSDINLKKTKQNSYKRKKASEMCYSYKIS